MIIYVHVYDIYIVSSLLAVTVSTRQSTKTSTREMANFNHNPPCKAQFFAACAIALPSCSRKLEHAKWHEATHQKARTGARKMARGNPPKSTNWSTQSGTRQPTKKHELEHAKWHEATHQKAQTGARKVAQGNPPKSTNWSTQNGTRQPTKKHELEHAKWHEATHQKARTGARKMARGNPPKSTNWSTQSGTRQPTKSTRNSCRESKKVGQVKNRYTQIIPLKSPIASSQEKQFALCTFWGVPIWKSLFLTVTGIRIDSTYIYIYVYIYIQIWQATVADRKIQKSTNDTKIGVFTSELWIGSLLFRWVKQRWVADTNAGLKKPLKNPWDPPDDVSQGWFE